MPGLEIEIFDDQFKRLPHDGETVGENSDPRAVDLFRVLPRPAARANFTTVGLITGDVGKIDPRNI